MYYEGCEQKQKTQEKAIKMKIEQDLKELEQCTFTPNRELTGGKNTSKSVR